jgi:indole-3-glycerol phosphate synthase
MNSLPNTISEIELGLREALEIRSHVQSLININRRKLEDLQFEAEFFQDHDEEIEETELFISETTQLLELINRIIDNIRRYIRELNELL